MREEDQRRAIPAEVAFADCVECGNRFPQTEVLTFEGYSVCAGCKAVFQQKLAEGSFQPSDLVYASVRRRAGAIMLDGALLWFIMSISYLGLFSLAFKGRDAGALTTGTALWYLFSILANAVYMIFFTGRFGGTPGKLALKLRIARADGGRVGYGLAAGRFFATFVSSMTLGIGYFMAAFDGEKRTLHDRMCGTRVVRA